MIKISKSYQLIIVIFLICLTVLYFYLNDETEESKV